MRPYLRLVALLAASLAAGCATPPPDVPPVLDIANRQCDAAPVLTGATVTAPTIDGDTEKPALATVTYHSPCLTLPEGKSLYTVFALPDGGPYTIRVSSVPLGSSLMAPRASILDAQGAVMRDLPVESFMFRGDNLTSLYRSHPGERYLLVHSDVPSVGKPLMRIKESVQQSYVSTGYATVVIYTGSDLPNSTTWAHNGEIAVSVVADKPAKK